MYQRGGLYQVCELSHMPLKMQLGKVMGKYIVKVTVFG